VKKKHRTAYVEITQNVKDCIELKTTADIEEGQDTPKKHAEYETNKRKL
jgi:hypothetical protein